MNIVGIIPARYGSTRFPGKPLVDLLGKPMIQHVVEKCERSHYLNQVIVATDDERIAQVVTDFGGEVLMTSSNHNSGTERCAECVNLLAEKPDYVVNIQGDEPLIQPQQIDELCNMLEEKRPLLMSLARELHNSKEINSPNVVKVVLNQLDEALYFSRSVIPYSRSGAKIPILQHVGIYAYEADCLQEIVKLPQSDLEEMEQLEQLRWLDYGYSILMQRTAFPTIAIDHPDDVHGVIQQMKKNG